MNGDVPVAARTGDAGLERNAPAPALQRPAGLRITALGGGHGLAVVLQGLMKHNLQTDSVGEEEPSLISAIVTAADDGGSSGALRRALHIQALGDLRRCLLALSNGDPTLQALFNFRFKTGLDRHSLGNLMLAALTLLEKDLDSAVGRAAELLGVQGQVMAATAANLELLAEFDDGGMLKGESKITADERRIRKLSLLPADVRASPAALAAIASSDLVAIGPGSVYTSLISILLLDEIVQAIVQSGAHVVLIMNLMTEINETLGYTAADILEAIHEHAPDLPIHTVLANDEPLPQAILQRYAIGGSVPTRVDPLRLETMGVATVSCNLLARGRKIRHDQVKLASALLSLQKNRMADTGVETEYMGAGSTIGYQRLLVPTYRDKAASRRRREPR